MLEILDQSTARKTRHQTQDHNKTRQEDRQRRANQRRKSKNEAGQAESKEAKRQESEAPNREKEAMKGEQKGARVLNTGSTRKGGGTDSPEPVYGQKSQVPTNPRRKARPVLGGGESETAG